MNKFDELYESVMEEASKLTLIKELEGKILKSVDLVNAKILAGGNVGDPKITFTTEDGEVYELTYSKRQGKRGKTQNAVRMNLGKIENLLNTPILSTNIKIINNSYDNDGDWGTTRDYWITFEMANSKRNEFKWSATVNQSSKVEGELEFKRIK